jgi:hypothetical protein
MTEDEKKAEAIRLLENAEHEAVKVEAVVQEIGKNARFVRDVARPFAQILRGIPADQMPPGGWDYQIESWRIWHSGAAEAQKMLSGIVPIGAMTYASVNSTFTTASMFFSQDQQKFPPGDAEAYAAVSQIIERQGLAGKATASMQRLGLDRHVGDRRSAVDLLHEANGAMERPVVEDGVTSVLIPLRESIDSVIAELLRRRPQQEQAKNWKDKVVSIGRHCGNASIPAGQFDKLGNDAKLLWGELSGAKQAGMDRQRLMSLIQRGLLLLNGLLEGVDESKLRPA